MKNTIANKIATLSTFDLAMEQVRDIIQVVIEDIQDCETSKENSKSIFALKVLKSRMYCGDSFFEVAKKLKAFKKEYNTVFENYAKDAIMIAFENLQNVELYGDRFVGTRNAGKAFILNVVR
jgi:hypothetical protein